MTRARQNSGAEEAETQSGESDVNTPARKPAASSGEPVKLHKAGGIKNEQDASFCANHSQKLRRFALENEISKRGARENMSTNPIIRYRHPIYGEQLRPQLNSPKASAQAANEPRAANEQSPTPETPETPDSANSLNPSADVEQFEPYMRLLMLIDSELFSNGQPTWEGGAEELQRELIKEGSACALEARRLLTWNGACARLLGRLHHAHPERIVRIHHHSARKWLIYPPEPSVTPETSEIT